MTGPADREGSCSSTRTVRVDDKCLSVASLARGLEAMGLSVDRGPAHLGIGPGVAGAENGAGPVLLDPAGDHRVVFFAALLSLFQPGVRCLEPGCVRKSWPGFWRDLERAGGTLSSS